MTELLSSGDLALVLADDGALVVEGAGTGAAVTPNACRGRSEFDHRGDEAMGPLGGGGAVITSSALSGCIAVPGMTGLTADDFVFGGPS